MERNRITVGLLAGGISEERKVSLETGKSVYSALLQLGYKVKLIDPAFGMNQISSDKEFFTRQTSKSSGQTFLETFNAKNFSGIDVVYNAMHGPLAEDGVTQTLLDLLGLKYVGADASASAIGMDKWLSKILFDKAGVKTPKGLLVTRNNYSEKDAKYFIEQNLSVPFIVKPNNQGSTIGLTLCKDITLLNDAVEKAFSVSDKVLIEEFVPGRELTAAVINGKAFPVLEIVPKSGLYDFEAKYESDDTDFIVPAEIKSRDAVTIQEWAVKAFEAIGCRDYGRVDFKLTENDEIFCLEINTLPGMTNHSLVPKMAQAAGIGFNELVDGLIINALER